MSDIASVGSAAAGAAAAATGSVGAQSAVATAVFTGTEALLETETAELLATLGVGKTLSAEA